MTVIAGTCAEVRLYLCYVLAVLRPGVRVPTFGEPEQFKGTLAAFTADEDLKLLIEESRRAVDRQETDLERIRSRATTLLTIGLAEIAVLSALAPRAFHDGLLVSILWWSSGVTVILGIVVPRRSSPRRPVWAGWTLARSPWAHRRSCAIPSMSICSHWGRARKRCERA